MAKNINTRIQLKRAALSDWNSSTIELKAGELAVAYVDVATQDAHGNIVHVPTTLLKSGAAEGNKTFKDLPFVSALAADVYAWAKKNGIEIIDAEGTSGEAISNIEWIDDKLVITRVDLVTPDELATELAGYYTKGEIDQLFTDLEISAVLDRISDLEDRADALEQKVDVETVSGAISAAVTPVSGRVETIEQELETYGDIVTHDVAEFATAEQGAKADAAAVKADVDAALDARYTKTDADAKFETIANADLIRADITAINAAETGIYDRAVAYVDGKFSDASLDQYTTEEEVKDIVDKVITDAVEGDTLTSLTDLVEYLSTHGGEYAELAATVQDHETRVGVVEAKPAMNITATQISNWDGEVGAKTLAQGVKDVVDNNKATWDKAGTALQAADITTGGANGTIAVGGTDVAVKGLGSAAYTDATAYATSEQGAKADSAVQSVAIAEGSANGKISLTVDGESTEISVPGLQDSAFTTIADIKTGFTGAIAEGNTGFVTGDELHTALANAATDTSDLINALDYTDTAVENQFVTSVSQEDGKISVTRQGITTDMIDGGEEVWYFDCGTHAEVI